MYSVFAGNLYKLECECTFVFEIKGVPIYGNSVKHPQLSQRINKVAAEQLFWR